MRNFLRVILIIFMLSGNWMIKSQPSGGPYGPVKVKYSLPKISGKIYFVSPGGKKDAAGE